MRKFLIGIVFAIGCMSLVSCVTSVSAQDDMYGSTEAVIVDDNTQIEVVITYGTPYIIDGLVQYYIYNNLYYYPYYYRNHFYWRMYRSPLLTYPRYWRPMPRAYWYRGGKFYHPRNFDRRHYDNVIMHNGHHRPHYDNRNGRGGQNHRFDRNRHIPNNGKITPRPNNNNNRVVPRQQGNRNFGQGRFPSSTRQTVHSRGSMPTRSAAPNRATTPNGRFGGRR